VLAMDIRHLGELNTEQFLTEAFDYECRLKLIRAARFRRNVYMALFLVGFACIFVAGLMGRMLLSILSLFLGTLSLVVMTKYDTQLFFLMGIKEKTEKKPDEA
jgi:uncharacterized membrane protein YjjP (DUF1212 family)